MKTYQVRTARQSYTVLAYSATEAIAWAAQQGTGVVMTCYPNR